MSYWRACKEISIIERDKNLKSNLSLRKIHSKSKNSKDRSEVQ